MSRHSKQYFHQTMDRGNSRNGSVPVMSTYPIGQSVIDMTSVFTAAFPLRRRGVPISGRPSNRWMMAGVFSPASPLISIRYSHSAYSLFMIKGMQVTAYAIGSMCT